MWWAFCDFRLDRLLLYWGPSVLDKRVVTGPIITHLSLACVQTIPRLPKLWSHAHGRQSCYRRVMADTYSMTIKAIRFPLDKINNESLSKVGKERYKKHVISEIAKARKEIISINSEIKRKRLGCCVQLCYRTNTKKGTTSSTWITLQENPTIEIIHFKGTNLNDLCPRKFFILNRGWAFRGREEISLLVHVCHSTFSISLLSLFSPFCYFDSFSTPILSFLTLTRVVLWWKWCYDSLLVITNVAMMILCTARALYILHIVTDFYHFSF